MIVCESGGHANGLTYFIFRFLRRPPQERAGVAAEDGAARGVRTGHSAQQHRTGRIRPQGLAELGAALSARAVQEAGRHAQGAVRRGGARHGRSPQQRLRRGDERAAAAGQARRARLQDEPELHRHRLPAHVQAQAPAGQPVRASHADMTRSVSTQNGIEPLPTALLTATRHLKNDRSYLGSPRFQCNK